MLFFSRNFAKINFAKHMLNFVRKKVFYTFAKNSKKTHFSRNVALVFAFYILRTECEKNANFFDEKQYPHFYKKPYISYFAGQCVPGNS